MTIKEAEARTGLARANIRYYEEQGFFSAARGENGYRNYSEEDVDTLLKVKLLRQLGFSLEDIHDLQRGERDLGSALDARLAGLEKEQGELDRAARLCRELRQDGADFSTLNAQRYLDRLSQTEKVLEKDRDPVRIFPWRRLFARDLDFLLYQTLIILVLQLFVRLNMILLSEDAGQRFLLTLGSLAMMLAVETLSLTLTGTTPGKWLLGLKILREDGSRLSFEEAGRRTIYVVLFYGFAQALTVSGVPLFVLGGAAMFIWACWQVYHEKLLPWEDDQIYLDGSTKVRTFWEDGKNYLRIGGYLAVCAACVGLMAGGHLLAARPPHRGTSLTAEQFVDNYNQCMAFAYGEGNLTRRLTLGGTFEEKEPEGVVVYVLGEPQVPEGYFFFGQGEGGLSKVVFTRRYDASGPLRKEESYSVGIPYDEIYVAMRSFLWGRLGNKGINALYEALEAQEGNYHTSLGGVQVDSDMRFTGYQFFGKDYLFAQEGEKQSYFVEFTIALTE